MIVSIVEIDNNSLSKVSISLSLTGKKNSYVEVVTNYTVPHNKAKSITTGSFPAQFIKITCIRGTPISIKAIKVYGGEQILDKGLQTGVESFLALANTNKVIYN